MSAAPARLRLALCLLLCRLSAATERNNVKKPMKGNDAAWTVSDMQSLRINTWGIHGGAAHAVHGGLLKYRQVKDAVFLLLMGV